MPAACPIGRGTGGIHGHSRTRGHAADLHKRWVSATVPGVFHAGHAGSIPVIRSYFSAQADGLFRACQLTVSVNSQAESAHGTKAEAASLSSAGL